MSERVLKAGTHILFGSPANPMPEIMADALAQAVAQVPGIREAYLPQCFIPGDEEGKQVLVVGFAKGIQIPLAMECLMEKMRLVLPEREFIDILPFTVSAVPNEAKVLPCLILNRDDPKPWWKFWG